ncbi:transmembrane 6 superfamily member 2-like [Callorhinchus milii]|uniref:Transmembrane 6 superfamily member 2 n=1 Tax=Callorhinchus milii TaxID=7868 RepID=K4FT21_CALMI|nr:transmembrane 6 superfamily member 2-like [Callorhinchus milii]AFK11283.1 transmembrane 6 superfamily member 2 [Callorhinchus milii]|eukprot:gi/632961980/ref/XP_007897057.1/ PREDICTED: transmembrane 6 superfamily member 2-like [Callorhinchus milii]
MQLSADTMVLLLSLTAIPVSYLFNSFSAMGSSVLVFAGGAAVLLVLVLGVRVLLKANPPGDSLFYVFAVFSFTSVIDLIISLEQDGYITGFMAFYLKEGEPYLRSAYGIMICYWDGTVHYLLYLVMAASITRGQSYRKFGLYWVGSVLMSLPVLLIGTVIGKYGSEIRPSYLLNIPYLIIPLWAGKKIYEKPRTVSRTTPEEVAEEHKKLIYQRPVDLLLALYLMAAVAYTLFRGIVVLDCSFESCFNYIYHDEPYLKDPVGYPKIQMLMNMFYLLPFFCLALYGLIRPGCTWMMDATLVFAGALAQAQFSHIGASMHSRTPFTYRIPVDNTLTFLLVNILYAAGAQLLAYHCNKHSSFFLTGKESDKKHQ